MKKNKLRVVVFWILLSLLFIFSTVIESVCEWFNLRFGVGFEEILFTITSPLKGSDTSFFNEAVEYILPAMKICFFIIVTAVFLFIVFYCIVNIQFHVKIGKFKRTISFYKIYQTVSLVLVLAICCYSINYVESSLNIREYIARKLDATSIYDEYYVNPDEIRISNEANAKNIIYIYLESMETTYASTNVGGYQEINYIPRLTELAEENISFSHNDSLGGAKVTTGAGWTMGAIFASTTGVPFSLPVDGNGMDAFEYFTPGITSLGDILEKYGYNQVFLCGSDAVFGGRKNYFEQHGNYNVFDYDDIVRKGYVDEDYYVWWGVEDQKLYDVAKAEILELSQENEPFNFTMLTVDTHHIDGYLCDLCTDTYDSQLANVLECADKQIYDFINWCKEQDFYENTVIVITGDHLRMDSSLVSEASGTGVRRIYNCFINSSKEPALSVKNRVFTTLDFFPTVLSAMGFEIEGNHLGLGTDLFSDANTLAEELGFEAFNAELRKYSKYYEDNFK